MGTTHLIAIKDDRLLKSIGRDLFSFVTLACMVGAGWMLDISALQWVGAILWFVWLIFRTSESYKKTVMTIPQAREFLDELEPDNA